MLVLSGGGGGVLGGWGPVTSPVMPTDLLSVTPTQSCRQARGITSPLGAGGGPALIACGGLGGGEDVVV